MSSKTRLVLGLAAAAAAGVIIGILLAPDSGTQTRGRIKSTAGDWTDSLSDLFSAAKEELSHLKAEGAKAASDAASKAGSKFSDLKKSYT